jgi:hypothetical protein
MRRRFDAQCFQIGKSNGASYTDPKTSH